MKFSTIGLGFALLTVLLQITLTGAGSLPIGDLPETYDRQSNGPSFMSAVSDIISRIFKPFTTWGDRSSVRQAYPDSTAEPEPVEAEPVEPPSGDNTAGTGGPPSGASTTESEGSASGGSANPPPPPPLPEDDTNGTTGVATGGHGPKEIFPTNLYQKEPHLTGPQNAIELLHNISNKKMNNEAMTTNETEVWDTSSTFIGEMVDEDSCYTFYSSTEVADAVCCEVLVDSESFGFCTMKDFLPSSTTTRMLRTDVRTVRPPAVRTNEMETGMNLKTSVRATTYIDLFNIMCLPPVDDGLCSQYCCDDTYASTDFCNSDLQCY